MFNNFFDIDKSISKNKEFNLSLILDTDQIIIGVKVLKERKRDHARIGLIINLEDGKWMYEVLDYYPSNDGSCGYVGSYETEQQAKLHTKGGYNRRIRKVYIDYKKIRQRYMK